MITPIAKKKDAVKIEEHRGVTLLPIAYKVYASVLANKLRKEMEEKKLVLQSQVGFRKGRGIIDNIYYTNYLVEREVGRGGKIVEALVDLLRTAFDSVNRRIMGKRLEEGMSRRLREKIMEIYEETRSVVKIDRSYGKRFWTTKRVKQECPLSPLLFNDK